MLEFLTSIPTVFWAAFVTGSAALAGVVISNRGNFKRLVVQLNNDRVLKAEERAAEWRQEIYAEAAVSLSTIQSAIGMMGNLEIQETAIAKDMSNAAHNLSKIQLIAGNEAVKIHAELSVMMVKAFGDLGRSRLNLKILQDKRKDCIAGFNERSVQREAILSHMKSINLDPAQFDKEMDRFQEICKECEDLVTLHESLNAQIHAATWAIQKEAISKLSEAGRLIALVNIVIRKELKLPFDEDSYQQVLELAYSQIEEVNAHNLIKIDQLIAGHQGTMK